MTGTAQEQVDLGVGYWRFVAYVLGGLALASWVVFAVLLGDDTREPSVWPWLWLAGAVAATVFSGTTAVLSAVKSMEERLRGQAP